MVHAPPSLPLIVVYATTTHILHHSLQASPRNIREDSYIRCSRGFVFPARSLLSIPTASTLTCVGRCSEDCGEIESKIYGSRTYDGVFPILPVGATRQFEVYCSMSGGGQTWPYFKSSMPTNLTWQQFKEGFGDDLKTIRYPGNFFIGLDNLHHLTSQASYTLLLRLYVSSCPSCDMGITSVDVIYDNFSVGSEDAAYVLQYDEAVAYSSDGEEIPSGNVFDMANPPRFATKDRDDNKCVEKTDNPGWYSALCQEYSPFASNVTWPVNNGTVAFSAVLFSLERTSDFYGNN
ncbi:hypothetical protein ACOMHN_048154 [Nucella lapillus]